MPVLRFPPSALARLREGGQRGAIPRGVALYLVRASDVPAGASVDSYYSRGIACGAL